MKSIKVTIKIDNVDRWDVDWTEEDKKLNELLALNDEIRRAIAEHCGIEYRNMTIDSALIDI